MRAIIIDDEPLSLAGTERMLKRLGVEVCGTFTDPFEALERCKDLQADAAFVDIEMPGISGLAAAERLQTVQPDIGIVFVTAYDHYAIHAFELNALDYLLKPVQIGRMEKTLARLAVRTEKPVRPVTMLCCFGRLGVSEGDGPAKEMAWRTAKAKEVFAYLLHHRNEPVSRDTLIDLMWPETDMGKAQTHLHTTVYQIRQTMKTAGLPAKLGFSDGKYRLELNGLQVDADVWEHQALSPASKAAHSLYRGDYFEEEGYLWAESERERLRIRWLESSLARAEAYGGQGRDSDAFALLAEVVRRFPLVQDGYFLLMRLHRRHGRPQEAKRVYERLRAVLLEETGETPRAEITAEYESY